MKNNMGNRGGWEDRFDKEFYFFGLFNYRDDRKINKHENIYKVVKQFVAKELQSQRQEIIQRLDKLMDKKKAEEIAGNMEKFTGKKDCSMCGHNPERERIMILSAIKQEEKS